MNKDFNHYGIDAEKELSELLNGKLIGSTDIRITEPEQIESAVSSSITFIGNKKYIALWEKSKASAAIIEQSLGLTHPGTNKAFIEVDNADLAMAKLNLAGIAMSKNRKREAQTLLTEAKKLDKHGMLKDQMKMLKDQMKKI